MLPVVPRYERKELSIESGIQNMVGTPSGANDEDFFNVACSPGPIINDRILELPVSKIYKRLHEKIQKVEKNKSDYCKAVSFSTATFQQFSLIRDSNEPRSHFSAIPTNRGSREKSCSNVKRSIRSRRTDSECGKAKITTDTSVASSKDVSNTYDLWADHNKENRSDVLNSGTSADIAEELELCALQQDNRTPSPLNTPLCGAPAITNVPQRPKRSCAQNISYKNFFALSRDNNNNRMSVYDYNYHHSDATGNGISISGNGSMNKYMTSKSHNVDDVYYGTDSTFKQQLTDIAASMAPLCNIGNSCYANSVVYTLRFTPLFLHNLHHLVQDFSQLTSKKESQQKSKSASLGRNVSGLQGQNARSWSSKDLASLGSSGSTSSSPALEVQTTAQQIVTEKLHELFQNLSTNETTESTEPYQSDLFLKAIQAVNPIFEGNQQQDAHEFLMCILDSIRESCQVFTKIITEHPELIANGFVSLGEPVDRPVVKPSTVPPLPVEKKTEKVSSWLKRPKNGKKNKMQADSPSKDANCTDTQVTPISVSVANGIDTDSNSITKQSIQDKIAALGLDFFSQDFEGITASSTTCLGCETITEQKETMIDLSVPITENMENVEFTDSFIQNLCITNERFQGENKFRCEKCMGYTEAIRRISYPKLPRLLVIQLKRFSGGMEKINSYIPTPFTLQCFCSSCCLNAKCDKTREHEYKLYSVITHVGATMCAGHYIAYTCSLNLNSAYVNCPKDSNRKEMQAAAQAASAANATNAASNSTTNSVNGTSAGSGSSNPKSSTNSSTNSSVSNLILKKVGFSIRNKASSNSVDSGKNTKTFNGVKGVVNGLDNMHVANNTSNAATVAVTNSVCPSATCCGIKMKTLPSASSSSTQIGNQYNNGSGNSMSNGNDYQEHSRKYSVYSDQYCQNSTSNVNTNNCDGLPSKTGSEPIWYMCDDDKIKAMPQQEFRDMLLPNKKNMITPYLLFYARNDVFTPYTPSK